MTANISKEELISLYLDQRLPMGEIASRYGVDRTTISNRLKSYNITSIPGQRAFSHYKGLELNSEQKEMVVGSVLGDGSIILPNKRKTAYFKVSHCEKQLEYIEWKRFVLSNFVHRDGLQKIIDKRGNSVMYSFNTISNIGFNYYRDLFYEDVVKVIKEELVDHLTLLGLAVWYMDDGGLVGNNKVNCRLSTDGFSKDDNYRLRDILLSKFGLESKVLSYYRGSFYYYLFFNKENSIKMGRMISPYVVECMRYKEVLWDL